MGLDLQFVLMGVWIIFVILTYDVNSKRVTKAKKICRKYLHHVQKSVFEGMITEAKLMQLKAELRALVLPSEDQVSIYKLDSLKYTSKEIIGVTTYSENIL